MFYEAGPHQALEVNQLRVRALGDEVVHRLLRGPAQSAGRNRKSVYELVSVVCFLSAKGVRCSASLPRCAIITVGNMRLSASTSSDKKF